MKWPFPLLAVATALGVAACLALLLSLLRWGHPLETAALPAPAERSPAAGPAPESQDFAEDFFTIHLPVGWTRTEATDRARQRDPFQVSRIGYVSGTGDYLVVQLGGHADWPRVDVTWPCRVRGEALEYVELPYCDRPLQVCMPEDGRVDVGLDCNVAGRMVRLHYSAPWRHGSDGREEGVKLAPLRSLLASFRLRREQLTPRPDQGVRPLRAEVAWVKASSEMPDAPGYTFAAEHLVDGDPTTCWQPRRTPEGGVGAWVRLTFRRAVTVTALDVVNGFQVQDRLGDQFLLNSRVARATLQCSDGSEAPLEVDAGSRLVQRLEFPPRRCDWIVVRVEAVEPGTRWPDLAIGELVPIGAP